MIWTWKDVKLFSLQKMFAADGITIPSDESVKDYVASMPQACNEALSILSRVGRYVLKSVSIAHNPIPNMISEPHDLVLLNDSATVEMEGAKSYYFEYTGTGTLKVYSDELLVDTVELDSDSYAVKKGFLTGSKVKFEFIPTYPLTIANLAFYSVSFKSEDYIPAYQDCEKYDLKTLVSDFHHIEDVYYNGVKQKYAQTSTYAFEGEHTLVLRTDKPGKYLVYYRSFPQMVTSDTTDDYIFDLPDDLMLLLPVYIASELYKEDDLAIATSYRNEFEVELARLAEDSADAPTSERFTSESGWI
jgi:hypothetical protein